MKKKFFAVATLALAFAFAFTASAAYDLGSTTLKRGSKGAAVSQLQMALNACNSAGLSTDGIFGGGTDSAVKAFQASKGLGADGLVGSKTKAALNSCGSSTPSTPSSSAALCPNGMTLASNCTMSPNASNWGSSSAEGYVTDAASDSANRVSDVYESESDKVVHGFRVTAKLADQRVERVQVIFDNNSGNGSENLAKYISSVSLWNGSTKLATMSVADADRSQTDESYTFNFTGLTSVIAKDQVGRFYVSVNANGSIDTNDTTADWTISIPSSGFRASSPNGVYVTGFTSGSVSNVTNLSFGKFASSGVKAVISLAASSPLAYTQEVSKTTAENNVTLLDFNVKAEVSPVTLRNVPIQLTSVAAPSVFMNNLKLMRDGQIVADIAPAAFSTFTNLSSSLATVPAGQTVKYSVVADFKSQGSTYGTYGNGTTVSAKIATIASGTSGFSIVDSAGDQVTSRSGSANGYTVTLASEGASASLVGTGTYLAPDTDGSTMDGTIAISFNVTAFGGEIELADDGSDIGYTLTGSTETDAIVTVDGLTVNGSNDFVIPEGQTRKVTLSLKHYGVTGFVRLTVNTVAGTPVTNIKTSDF